MAGKSLKKPVKKIINSFCMFVGLHFILYTFPFSVYSKISVVIFIAFIIKKLLHNAYSHWKLLWVDRNGREYLSLEQDLYVFYVKYLYSILYKMIKI